MAWQHAAEGLVRSRSSSSAEPVAQVEGHDPQAVLAEARAVDERIKAIVTARRTAKAELADHLAHVSERRLFLALGFPDVVAYALDRGVAGSARHVRELLAVSRKLDELPETRAAFRAGEVDWTKVRAIAPVATPEDEHEWLALARSESTRACEAAARLERGEPESVRRVFELTPEQDAWFQQAAARMREQVKRSMTHAEVLEAVVNHWLQGGSVGETAAAPTTRVVIQRCECEKRATIESREGSVEISAASVEQALCNAEVLDSRKGPAARVTRTVPPRIANFVHARDRGRCRVPGCGAIGFLHQHHEGGRRVVGHDPASMLLLCTAHHAARHEGLLVIEKSADGFRFALADGSRLESPACSREPTQAVEAPASSRERSQAVALPARSREQVDVAAGSPCSREVEATAIEALVKLEAPRTQARALVRRAVAALRSASAAVSVENVVLEALRGLPSPGGFVDGRRRAS